MLVEIWSDVVCPWCAIGKARFEQALDSWAHAEEVTVRWRSFELDPNRQGTVEGDYVDLLARKYGASREQAQGMVDRMVATGADEGIEFRFDIARPGNTFDAHRLLHLAADRGVQHAVKARFLAGYHSQGVAIAEHDELTDLATDAGLDREEVTDVLAGETYGDAVRADEEQARDYGIRGVPFFVLDGQVGVSGAQPVGHLRSALEQVRARGHTVEGRAAHDGHDHGPDEACVDGVCAV